MCIPQNPIFSGFEYSSDLDGGRPFLGDIYLPKYYSFAQVMCKGCLKVFEAHPLAQSCPECKSKKLRSSALFSKKKRSEINLERLREARNKPCERCGESFPLECMDLDHINPSSKKKTGKYRSNRELKLAGKETIDELLASTRVLCANCHRIVTLESGHNTTIQKHIELSERTKGSRKSKKKLERRKVMVSALKNSPCKDCRKTYPPCAMDFDHVGEKNGAVSKMVLRRASKESILNEISLCELVCANCHRIRTKSRR